MFPYLNAIWTPDSYSDVQMAGKSWNCCSMDRQIFNMLSVVQQMNYRWKALLMHQGPIQIPSVVVLAKPPRKGFGHFSTYT